MPGGSATTVDGASVPTSLQSLLQMAFWMLGLHQHYHCHHHYTRHGQSLAYHFKTILAEMRLGRAKTGTGPVALALWLPMGTIAQPAL